MVSFFDSQCRETLMHRQMCTLPTCANKSTTKQLLYLSRSLFSCSAFSAASLASSSFCCCSRNNARLLSSSACPFSKFSFRRSSNVNKLPATRKYHELKVCLLQSRPDPALPMASSSRPRMISIEASPSGVEV